MFDHPIPLPRRCSDRSPQGHAKGRRCTDHLDHATSSNFMLMSQHVFVFGTLKKGFPLHERGLRDAMFLGSYSTRACFPLVIAGPRFAPMMFNEPGVGFRSLVSSTMSTNKR